MLESLLFLSLLGILGLSTKYIWDRYKKLKRNILDHRNKLNKLNKTIVKEIQSRKNEIYYKNLKESYSNIKERVITSDDKVTIKNMKCLNNLLVLVDDFHIHLNKDLNKIDEFNHFENTFSNKKRKYRQLFNKSIETLNTINEQYGDIVSKYIKEFNKDYNTYKQNEIVTLNKYVKKCKQFVDNYDIKNLNKHFCDIKQIDTDLNIKLTEPIRLYDKIESSEENVEQLEGDLDNNKGSLYHKTFNIIKNHRVTQEETSEWNSLKKKINYYKKNRLLKSDIIKLNEDLNIIINTMLEICDKINTNKEAVVTKKEIEGDKI